MVFEISRISGITTFYNQLMSSMIFPVLSLIHIFRNGLGIQFNKMKCIVTKCFFFETLFEYDKTEKFINIFRTKSHLYITVY